jgi:hypothetical protein
VWRKVVARPLPVPLFSSCCCLCSVSRRITGRNAMLRRIRHAPPRRQPPSGRTQKGQLTEPRFAWYKYRRSDFTRERGSARSLHLGFAHRQRRRAERDSSGRALARRKLSSALPALWPSARQRSLQHMLGSQRDTEKHSGPGPCDGTGSAASAHAKISARVLLYEHRQP